MQQERQAMNLRIRALSAATSERQSDIMSPDKRSALMARIRSRDTGPELIVRRLLHSIGYRFRVHAPNLPGRPDIVFSSRRTVIFVHGCFWHRHDCGMAYTPKTRRQFWQSKFNGNVKRDRRVRDELAADGWQVIIIWECQTKKPFALAKRLARVLGPAGRGPPRASSSR
jgi:DNA mismatch endonuclease, patch repair protein